MFLNEHLSIEVSPLGWIGEIFGFFDVLPLSRRSCLYQWSTRIGRGWPMPDPGNPVPEGPPPPAPTSRPSTQRGYRWVPTCCSLNGVCVDIGWGDVNGWGIMLVCPKVDNKAPSTVAVKDIPGSIEAGSRSLKTRLCHVSCCGSSDGVWWVGECTPIRSSE